MLSFKLGQHPLDLLVLVFAPLRGHPHFPGVRGRSVGELKWKQIFVKFS